MVKHVKTLDTGLPRVRTRRAYFDCRFGQLHVRTAFPATGGFDEGTTLFCLHSEQASSRIFSQFLPEIGEDRSIYAPDLPGCGESDPPLEGSAPLPEPTLVEGRGFGEAAAAVADLASDLRLRQIDVLGFRFGAGVALQLAVSRPELVRRLVLVASPPIDGLPIIEQPSLVLRVKLGAGDDSQWTVGTLPNAQFMDLVDYAANVFEAAPQNLAKRIGAFLNAPI